MAKTCYMCANPKTSREHVPPQCLFPPAESIGKNLRSNLISVPSCDTHNNKKSGLDEVLRSVLCMSINVNSVGTHLFFTSNLRAMQRSRALFHDVVRDSELLAGGVARIVRVPRDKFDVSIDHMARGLYFHAYADKWTAPILVHSPNFYAGATGEAVETDPETDMVVNELRPLLANVPVLGDNPEVFCYRIARDDAALLFAMAALFYGAFEVFAISSSGGADVTK